MNAPPEDCGGIRGFYEKPETAADEADPDHAESAGWLGDDDPAALDEAVIRRDLSALAVRLGRHSKTARRTTKA